MFLTVAAVLLILVGHSEVSSQVRAATTAQFVFGDSLVDQGNNNDLNSLAKSNFRPFGVDYAEGNYVPTGRFSNGRVTPDFISEYMNLPKILAYSDPNAHGNSLLAGCNFASAGSGIVDDTGDVFIQKVSMTEQFANYQNVVGELSGILGNAGAAQLVNDALFSFTAGGNDFTNNYLIPGSARSSQLSIPDFTNLLISTFEAKLKEIYNRGARKISVANIGPIGCIPDQLSTKSAAGECVDSVNKMGTDFNALLVPMLNSLKQQLPGVTIVVKDYYGIVSELVYNAANYGFTVVNVACCGTGRFNGNIPCILGTPYCSDRYGYLFWDTFHTTDRANSIIAQRLLYGGPSDVSPMNLSQLINL